MKHLCWYLHRLGEAWFLHVPALKRRQISGLSEWGLEMLPEDAVARLGYERTGRCAHSLLLRDLVGCMSSRSSRLLHDLLSRAHR